MKPFHVAGNAYPHGGNRLSARQCLNLATLLTRCSSYFFTCDDRSAEREVCRTPARMRPSRCIEKKHRSAESFHAIGDDANFD
jgi:hypothetical protein